MQALISSRTTLVVRSLILALILSVPSAAPASAIQGGTTVTASSAPWLVGVISRMPNGDENRCSGSVIAARWILTAAHCVTNVSNNSALSPSAIRVLAPGLSPDSAGAWERGVAPLDVYPSGLYTFYTDGFYPWADIALIELEAGISGTKSIRLDSPTASNPNGTPVRAYGWGMINTRGTSTGRLARSAPLKVLASSGDATCRQWTVNNDNQGPSLICAGSNLRSVGVCSGDSGGPLIKAGRIPVQIGITSFAGMSGCATYNQPGQFVRIATMRWWIDSVIGKASVLSPTEGTDEWPYFAGAQYLFDAVEVGESGNILILGGHDDDDGANWMYSWAERVYGNVARHDLTFASEYNGRDQFNFFDETIGDANVLSDGRPIWATTETFGSSTVSLINVTQADGNGERYDIWESGTELAEKILGKEYSNGWRMSYPSLAPTADGGAVVVYEISQGNFGTADIVVAEWAVGGRLASSFGGDGWARFGAVGINERPYEVVLLADGRIAVLGSYEQSCAVWILKREGQLDTSWDQDGVKTFGSRGCIARSATEDENGGLFVVGADVAQTQTSNSSAFITHLNQSGALDTTFGVAGYVWARTPGVDYLMDICKTANGVLVAAGQSSASERRNHKSGVGSLGLLVVVSDSGKATSTFGTQTYREFALGGQNDYFVSTECLSNGSVGIGGQSIIGKGDGTDDLWSFILKINVTP